MGKTTENYDFNVLSGRHYKKSNALINSKGKANLLAQKLFAVGIQQAVEDEKTGILESVMYGTDLKKIFGTTNSGSFYDKIKALVNPVKNKPSLLDWRVIFTDDESKKIEAINVIMDCSFENGVLKIRYNDKVNKQIKDLQANYTVLSLAETIPLSSIYSFKLYEILKSEYDKQDCIAKKNGTWKPNTVYVVEIDITDLKLRFGIIDASTSIEITNALKQENPDFKKIEKLADELVNSLPDNLRKEHIKYKRFDNFKKQAIEIPKKELAEKTSIYFDYEPIRSGRGGKTTAIRFYIHKKLNEANSVDKVKLSDEEKDNFLDDLIDLFEGKIKKTKDRRAIAEAANYNYDLIEEKYKLSQTQNIDNLVGWLISAIKEDYQKPISTIKNNYDFEESDTVYDEELLLDN